MRALVLLAILLGCASVVAADTDAAHYVRGIAFLTMIGVYVAIAWPAYRAPHHYES